MATQLPAGVKEVQRVAAPGGGYYVLGSDGGVFAISDDKGKTPTFYGSYKGLKPEQRQGTRNFTGISLDPTGGYTLQSDKGETYRFDTGQARAMGLNVPDASNTVYGNPAFMAFLRTSGMDVDQAAADVQRQTTDINNRLNVQLGDIDTDYDRQNIRTRGGFESRGILRSSSRQEAEDVNEDHRGRAKVGARQTAADSIAGLNRGLTNKIIGVQTQAAEKGITVGDTQALEGWTNEMKKKYPGLVGGS